MLTVLSMTYYWLKAGHIIFVIFWMAGLFMLPRYFVYHQEAAEGSPENAVWTDREGKLLKIILWPSMTIVWVLCPALAWQTVSTGPGLTYVKFAAVLVLSAYHVGFRVITRFWRKESASFRQAVEDPQRSAGDCRRAIVIMVVVRPF
jgi:putative membrane protein